MKTALRLLLITVPLAALGAAFLAYVITNRPEPVRIDIAELATPVRVIQTVPADLPTRVTAYGLVRPTRVLEAIAQVGGTAEWVDPALKSGAILPAGRVFLRLSQSDYALAVAQAQANIRATKAKLAELNVSEQNQIASLDLERKLLDIRKADQERTAKLVERGAASTTALDQARAAWLAQRQKVLNLENGLALLPTQRQVLIEQIAVYETTLKTARLNLERTDLSLPFTGRVAKVAVETGQFVRQGQVVAVFDGIGSAEVEARVSLSEMAALTRPAADGAARDAAAQPQGDDQARTQADAAAHGDLLDPLLLERRLKDLGLRAELRLNVGGQVLRWPGRVDRLSDAIDQKTGTLGVIVRVDDAYSSATPGAKPPLTKGMFVEVALTGPENRGIIVPRSALRDGKVMVADDEDRLRLVPVRAARVQDDVALIAAGLEPGVRVVVSDLSPRVPGQLLTPMRDEDLEARLAAQAAAGQPERAK